MKAREKNYINPDSLSKIAIFLEGMKKGSNNTLHPLGTVDLEELWKAFHYLRGDERYDCKAVEDKMEERLSKLKNETIERKELNLYPLRHNYKPLKEMDIPANIGRLNIGKNGDIRNTGA